MPFVAVRVRDVTAGTGKFPTGDPGGHALGQGAGVGVGVGVGGGHAVDGVGHGTGAGGVASGTGAGVGGHDGVGAWHTSGG
jgi:hypothetical protein